MSSPVTIVSSIKPSPDKIDMFIAGFNQMASALRAGMSDVLQYELYTTSTSGEYLFVSRWANMEAFNAHKAAIQQDDNIKKEKAAGLMKEEAYERVLGYGESAPISGYHIAGFGSR